MSIQTHKTISSTSEHKLRFFLMKSESFLIMNAQRVGDWHGREEIVE